MTTALATIDAAPLVTPEQLDLVRRTVASGATADELKLYLFDCQRQGVHPLDKLVHFTKRSGKYTPITSIDFMRIRAADTGEYAGSDDAVFVTHPQPTSVGHMDLVSATVTVWRLVQGQRVPFTATARWSEYKPEQNDFMWKKMPHTMLAKCAEALALRKGFPRQLAGLYAKEEMDQADAAPAGYVVTAPAPPRDVREKPAARLVENSGDSSAAFTQGVSATAPNAVTDRVVPNGGDSGRSDEGPDHGVDLPAGALRILSVGPGVASAKAEIKFHKPVGESNRDTLLTFKDQIKALAEQLCQDGEPCFVGLKRSASGNWRIEDLTRVPKNYDAPTPLAPMTADEISF